MYWTIEALTGNRELGFCSGEGAWETATTSKEGSRRVNYPILIKRGSDKKSQYFALGLNNCIENRVDILSINYWRASLVPAAAVIPAPMVYANIVAVKKLVVEFVRESILCVRYELQWMLITLICSFLVLEFSFWQLIKCLFTLRKFVCSKQSYGWILKHGIISNDIDQFLMVWEIIVMIYRVCRRY